MEGIFMPWIETEDCSGCGICVSKCPVGTIYLQEGVALFNHKNQLLRRW